MDASRRRMIQDFLTDASLRHGATTAVICRKRGCVSYAALEDQAVRISGTLQSSDIARGDRIAICLERGSDCIAAMFGILRAGGIYVPIAATSPVARLRAIVEDCGARAILCDARSMDRVQQAIQGLRSGGREVFLLRDVECGPGLETIAPNRSARSRESGARPIAEACPQDTAYILYTSGSTGQPKGVMISHENVVAYADWARRYFRLNPHDTVLSTAPFHFDMSTFDVYAPISAGARIALADERDISFPSLLVDRIQSEVVTVWKGVSSLLMFMSRAGVLDTTRLASLRAVVFAGEELHPKYLRDWMQRVPGARYFNAYGPTEATGVSACYAVPMDCPFEGARIPIGRPCDGKSIQVEMADGEEASPGIVGEILIAGNGLSSGYWADPARTERAFTVRENATGGKRRWYRTGDLGYFDEDGELHFVGRKDEQIKFQGYRVEPGEINTAIISLGGVNDAFTVLARKGPQDPGELLTFLESSETIAITDLRKHLQDLLPSYMIPKRILAVDALPRTDRGKIDREALLALARQ